MTHGHIYIYIHIFQAVNPPSIFFLFIYVYIPGREPPLPPQWGGGVVGWWGGGVVGWWGGGVVGWWGGWVVGWLGGWVVGVWFGVGLGLVGWFKGGFRVGLRWVSGGFGVWVDLGLGLGLRRGCRVVWFRVGCCERCWGVGSRGERGSLGPKLQGQHPQHCQHHPQDADDAGEGGDHTIWGGGGGYVAQGLVHIYIYIYICTYCISMRYQFSGSI